MSERLPRLLERDLTPQQRTVYDAIIGGPRAGGPQLFELRDSAGSLNGPFGLMLHVPNLGLPLQELGAAIRYRTSLTGREREIALLVVAAALDSEFEAYAHERVGAHIGLTASELAQLRELDFTSADAGESATFAVASALVRGAGVGDDEYTRLVTALGETKLLEITVLVGYYTTLATLMHVFEVGVPELTEGSD